jgi:POT family proton-dependent oligopeptide transporter
VVANFAHIPENLADPLESLRIYTSLFNRLGFAGIVCTLIAIAMLPLMKKLSTSHSDAATASTPLPAVRSEEFNTAG